MSDRNNVFYSKDGNPEVWEKKPEGYMTEQEWLASPPTPDMINKKLDEIKELRKVEEYGGILFNGLTVETDNDSQSKLTGAMTAYQATGIFSNIWKCQDGWLELKVSDEFIALCMAVNGHVMKCFRKELHYTMIIQNAKSITEFMNISWGDASWTE